MTGLEPAAVVSLELHDHAELFEAPELAPLDGRYESRSGVDRILDDPGVTANGPRIVLDLRLPDHAPTSTSPAPDAAAIAGALRGYSRQRITALDARLARIRRRGLIELVAGSIFLAACLALSGVLATVSDGSFWVTEFLAEGLVIVGWIALWHPVDLLLFEPWTHRRERGVLRRLSSAQVRIARTSEPG
ncbi:hypothetical protein GCM10017608_02350 [Agromyces luteolus]|uniref:Uncharacterized protein n=1 Tax=Agromyces luteolus TaxID=88373 RepID=A0A7C9LVK4_9MICO|nr:hypothetical protein [Agromyces luteolus]MUN05757.1 hypothetical protein [Agromyces luteolus]GLK26303.1 hypothetical protein GCM10017608_02350 [Agromyces luteolus]